MGGGGHVKCIVQVVVGPDRRAERQAVPLLVTSQVPPCGGSAMAAATIAWLVPYTCLHAVWLAWGVQGAFTVDDLVGRYTGSWL
jgi:hypothetical protein